MGEIVYTGNSKGRVIKSVSITQEDDAIITGLGLSLSGILRQKIQEIRENSQNWKNLLLQREETIEKLVKEIQRLHEEYGT